MTLYYDDALVFQSFVQLMLLFEQTNEQKIKQKTYKQRQTNFSVLKLTHYLLKF